MPPILFWLYHLKILLKILLILSINVENIQHFTDWTLILLSGGGLDQEVFVKGQRKGQHEILVEDFT